MNTPATRAARWAKAHGRPMDSTVIEAYLKGWNAGIRSTCHLRRDQVTAQSNAFAMYQQAGAVTKERDDLIAALTKLANAEWSDHSGFLERREIARAALRALNEVRP